MVRLILETLRYIVIDQQALKNVAFIHPNVQESAKNIIINLYNHFAKGCEGKDWFDLASKIDAISAYVSHYDLPWHPNFLW